MLPFLDAIIFVIILCVIVSVIIVFFCCQFLILRNVKRLLREKWTEFEMFLPIATGKCSERLLGSHWALFKENGKNGKATGKCPKATG
jgi:hypothetical protein